MATDIKIVWDTDLASGDLELNNGDLTREDGLATAVLISLFTDRRVTEEEIINNPEDRRGWWGDLVPDVEGDEIGSKLWLLDRSKTTKDTLVKAEEYAAEALQWMIDDGVAQKINVTAERFGDIGNDRLGLTIEIFQSDGDKIAYKFDDLWKGEMNAI